MTSKFSNFRRWMIEYLKKYTKICRILGICFVPKGDSPAAVVVLNPEATTPVAGGYVWYENRTWIWSCFWCKQVQLFKKEWLRFMLCWDTIFRPSWDFPWILRILEAWPIGGVTIKQHPAWRQPSEFSVGTDPIRADASARIHEIRYRDIAF